jgi:hypothetical protein
MRELHARGELLSPARELFERRGPCEELYDLKNDPWEIKDLVHSSKPEDRQALKRLQGALEEWIVETNDRGAVSEPPEIAKTIEKEMEVWFGTPSWAKP